MLSTLHFPLFFVTPRCNRFELEEAGLAAESMGQQLQETLAAIKARDMDLEAASVLEGQLRVALDESASRVAALRPSLDHSVHSDSAKGGLNESLQHEIKKAENLASEELTQVASWYPAFGPRRLHPTPSPRPLLLRVYSSHACILIHVPLCS